MSYIMLQTKITYPEPDSSRKSVEIEHDTFFARYPEIVRGAILRRMVNALEAYNVTEKDVIKARDYASESEEAQHMYITENVSGRGRCIAKFVGENQAEVILTPDILDIPRRVEYKFEIYTDEGRLCDLKQL